MFRGTSTSAFLLVCVASFGALRMLVGATSALFLLDQGLDLSRLAYLKAMQAVIVVLLEVPLGYLADSLGRRWAIIGAVGFGAAWLLMTGLAPSPGWLWGAEVCNALSICLSTGAMTAEFLDRRLDEESHLEGEGGTSQQDEMGLRDGAREAGADAEPDRAREALALLSRWEFSASALAAGLGGLLYPAFPRGTWVAAGVGCLGIACAYLVYSRHFPPLGFGATTRGPADPEARGHGGSDRWRTVFGLRRRLLGSIAVAGLLYAAFQVAIQYWQVSVTEVFPESFADHSLGPVLGGLFVAILWVQSRVTSLSRVVAASPSGYLLAAGLPATGWLVAQVTGSFLVLAAALLLFFWCFRACDVAVSAAISTAAGAGLRATALAARSTLARILAASLLPAAGVAVTRFDGSVGAVVVVLAVCLAAGTVFAVNAALARRAE